MWSEETLEREAIPLIDAKIWPVSCHSCWPSRWHSEQARTRF